MRYINIKTFHKNFFNEVKDLPVTITRLGVPALVLTKVDTNVDTNVVPPKNFSKIPEMPISLNQTEGPRGFEKKEEPLGRCVAFGCVEDAVGLGKVWEDGEELEVPMCKKHLFKSLKEHS